jgi:hypothetical protein
VLGFQQHLLQYRGNSDRGLALYRDAWDGATGFLQTSQGEQARAKAVRTHAQRVASGPDASEAHYKRVVADPSSSEDQKRKAQRVRAKYRWLENYHDSYCRLARLPDQFLVSTD